MAYNNITNMRWECRPRGVARMCTAARISALSRHRRRHVHCAERPRRPSGAPPKKLSHPIGTIPVAPPSPHREPPHRRQPNLCSYGPIELRPYVVMACPPPQELLGDNLTEFRRRQPDGCFSLHTSLRLGMQAKHR